MFLKNKKILITAGPTWVPIDKVRVISNIATGETGIILAKYANRLGAKITLILGPVGRVKLNKSIRIMRFCFFDELHNLIKKELKTKKYDIVIHSAAVSDYKPKRFFSEKIKSDKKRLSLDLETTVKIVDKIKKYAPKIFLAIFKLELDKSKEGLIDEARKVMFESNADLAVANTFTPTPGSHGCQAVVWGFSNRSYKAFIVDKNRILGFSNCKEKLAKKLLSVISTELN